MLAVLMFVAGISIAPIGADTPQRLGGTWNLDASSGDGPVIKVEFDAALVKEIKGQ